MLWVSMLWMSMLWNIGEWAPFVDIFLYLKSFRLNYPGISEKIQWEVTLIELDHIVGVWMLNLYTSTMYLFLIYSVPPKPSWNSALKENRIKNQGRNVCRLHNHHSHTLSTCSSIIKNNIKKISVPNYYFLKSHNPRDNQGKSISTMIPKMY